MPCVIGLKSRILWGSLVVAAVAAAMLQMSPETSKAATVPKPPSGKLNVPSLVGMTVTQAEDAAHQAGGTLTFSYADSTKPTGRVISVGPNPEEFPQEPFQVVVSSGPLHNSYSVLPLATVPPVAAECAGGRQLFADGTSGPLLCGRDDVNVSVWDAFASLRPKVMMLTRHATLRAIERAACAPVGTTQMASDAYVLANAYYGWHRPHLTQALLYGVKGKSCRQLGF